MLNAETDTIKRVLSEPFFCTLLRVCRFSEPSKECSHWSIPSSVPQDHIIRIASLVQSHLKEILDRDDPIPPKSSQLMQRKTKSLPMIMESVSEESDTVTESETDPSSSSGQDDGSQSSPAPVVNSRWANVRKANPFLAMSESDPEEPGEHPNPSMPSSSIELDKNAAVPVKRKNPVMIASEDEA